MLTEIQTAIRDTVRSFAQDAIRPHSARFEAEGGYPSALFEEMAGLGLWGGGGWGIVHHRVDPEQHPGFRPAQGWQ